MFSAPESGVVMPRRERALSEQRLKRAREDYEQWLTHMATSAACLLSEQRYQPGARGRGMQRRIARAELHGSGERADQPTRASSSGAA